MTTRLTLALLLLLTFGSCRKDESGEEPPMEPVPTVTVHYDQILAGYMRSGVRCPDGSYFLLMSAGIGRVVKLDPEGAIDAQFVPSWPPSVSPGPVADATDGGCIGVASNSEHLVVSRMDATGGSVSSRDYTFPGCDSPRSINRTGAATWMVSGHYQHSIGPSSLLVQDIWVMAVDLDGDSLWKRTFATQDEKWITGSVALANGDLLITSYYYQGGNYLLNAMRINPSGELVWEHDIGPAIPYAHGACETPSGDLLFTGGVLSGPITIQGMLYATNAAGDPLWQRSFGNSALNLWPTAVAINELNRIVVVGHTSPILSALTDDRLFAAGFYGDGTLSWDRYAADNDTVAYGLKVLPDAADHFTILGKGYPHQDGAVYWFTYLNGINSAGEFD